jgi:hypothetical protein
MISAPLRKNTSWHETYVQVGAQTKALNISPGGGEVPSTKGHLLARNFTSSRCSDQSPKHFTRGSEVPSTNGHLLAQNFTSSRCSDLRVHCGAVKCPSRLEMHLQSIDPEGTALNCSKGLHSMSGLPVGSGTEAKVSVHVVGRLGMCELKR